jgi:hypothetical protein
MQLIVVDRSAGYSVPTQNLVASHIHRYSKLKLCMHILHIENSNLPPHFQAQKYSYVSRENAGYQ